MVASKLGPYHEKELKRRSGLYHSIRFHSSSDTPICLACGSGLTSALISEFYTEKVSFVISLLIGGLLADIYRHKGKDVVTSEYPLKSYQ